MNLDLLLLAILQGVTELFPISSLGHSVLVPALLHWPIDRDAPWFLPYIVVLHLGTATALFVYFWKDWLSLLSGTVAARGSLRDPQARLFWLLVCGTVPAALLGLLLEHWIKGLFTGFAVAAVFLMINGAILLAGDRLKARVASQTPQSLSWMKAFLIGCAQALALIPGISRSGVTLVAGLMGGLDYAASARFSFLLATPIIGAAGVLELPKLMHQHATLPPGLLPVILLGGVLSGVFAWLSTWFLMRWFKSHELMAFRPFGIYCLAAGAASLLILLVWT
ncbi:MAG TPA: undecaprenyl-diphosphate phosphatase [Gammaproteobacteria bacterium]|nr:undecaprenyl-diphosphate phosphatase [Gammaproteobacteria bacterium]